ncbi:MAG: MraY family glycosyltransferase [Desulfatibacillaceae bacterium]
MREDSARIPEKLVFIAVAAAAVLLLLPPVRSFFFETGRRWFYILAVSFSLAYALVPLCREIAWVAGILDQPAERKVHTRVTPLLGGVAVFVAFIVSIIVNAIPSMELVGIVSGGLIVFVVSLVDDVREISASFKLVLQILATCIVMTTGVTLTVFPDATGIPGEVGNLLLTLLWVVGITNAFNFFDGMDGLAAGLGAILSFFLAMVALQTDHPFLGWISLAMMGSCLGFLPYNFRPYKRATIFLGDAGSTFIGFILAFLAVFGQWSDSDPVSALAPPLLIFWVLIFDMVHITVDRIITGKVRTVREWLEYVGKDHLHHRLMYVLGGPQRSVLFIYLMTCCLGLSAVVLRNASPMDVGLLLLQAAILVVLLTILERRGRNLSTRLETNGRGVDPLPDRKAAGESQDASGNRMAAGPL